MDLDRTRAPSRRSFIPVAADDDFPIQNLPYGVFRPAGDAAANRLPRCGAAIGEFVVDLAELQAAGLLPLSADQTVFAEPALNSFAALPRQQRFEVRCALSALLDQDNARLRDDPALLARVLYRRDQVRMLLPMQIGDYTDFYSSREHATNVGVMFRGPENALQPNWLHLPVAYHGRAGSVVVDGTPIVRPCGQIVPRGAATPEFGPTQALDFELEMGAFISAPSALASSVSIDDAEDHVFGLALVNDWSARDIQRWEYVPLGPFLGKNFATSVSPWIVTLEALEPFRCRGPAQDPRPLPYLCSEGPATFDIHLQVELAPTGLSNACTITRTNYRTLYWSLRQQIGASHQQRMPAANRRPAGLGHDQRRASRQLGQSIGANPQRRRTLVVAQRRQNGDVARWRHNQPAWLGSRRRIPRGLRRRARPDPACPSKLAPAGRGGALMISPQAFQHAGLDARQAQHWLQQLDALTVSAQPPEVVWRTLARDVLRPDDPFDAHRLVWRHVFRDWPASRGPIPAWTPTEQQIQASNAAALARDAGLDDVAALHAWSAAHRIQFWRLVLQRLGVAFQTPYDTVLDCQDARDPHWLPGARFNIVDSCFQAAPERTALIFQREGGALERFSYGELRSMMFAFAAGLRRLGVAAGDPIGMMAPLTPHSIAALLGCIHAGCVPVAIAESFAPAEIETRLNIAGARLLITQDVLVRDGKTLACYAKSQTIDSLERVIVLPHAGDQAAVPLDRRAIVWCEMLGDETPTDAHPANSASPSTILFSSGTTGTPKAIPWTHVTPIKCASDALLHHNTTSDSVLCWPTSLGWMMGPWLIYAGFINRATIAVFDGSPKGVEFTRFVRDAGVTMLGVVPSLVRAWRDSSAIEGDDWRGVQVFSSTGECSHADDMLFLMSRAGYQPIIEYCGGTEIGGGYVCGVITRPCAPATFNTPAMGLDFVILDSNEASEEEVAHDSTAATPGEPRDYHEQAEQGEVFLIPPSIGLSQTLSNADHDQVYYQGCPTWRGHVLRRHGDQLQRLPGGWFRVAGRTDDTMNLGGIKVSSAELERCFAGDPEVREAAAVAIADAQGGPNQLIVFVVACSPTAPPTEQSLRESLQRRLAPRSIRCFALAA